MAVVRKEWEDRYDEIKNMPDVPKNEQTKEEWEGKEMQFRARLLKIKDSTSPEYKAIMAERKETKKEYESQQIAYYSVQKYLETNGTNLEAVKKNFRQIDKTRENRDAYQTLLDELLEAKEANSKIELKREQIQAEIKKLDEELEDLKQQEKDALYAIENFAKTPEQKAAAQEWLEEIRGKIKINQNKFPEKHKELKVELEKPLIEVPENDIIELQEKIDRCNKTCELLLQGKTIGEVYNELGSKKSVETPKKETEQKEESKVEQPVPVGKTGSDLGEKKPEVEQPAPVGKTGSDLGEEKSKVEQPVPVGKTGSDLGEKKPEVEQPAPVGKTGSDLGEEKSKVEQPVPVGKTGSDLGEKKPEVEQPAPVGKTGSDLGEEKSKVEQPVLEKDGDFTLTRIRLNTSKEGTQIIVFKKERGKYYEEGKKGKVRKLPRNVGNQDEIIRTEIDKAVTDGLLTVDEAEEEIQLYEKLLQYYDKKEREKIIDSQMRLKLNYDLSGMMRAKISRENRKQIRANAAEALELGIGNVEPKWMKAVVKIERGWKKSKPSKLIKGIGNKIAGFLPAGKGEENQQEPKKGKRQSQEEAQTLKNKRKTDRFGNPVEKTPEQIEAEKFAENVGKTLDEIQKGNVNIR